MKTVKFYVRVTLNLQRKCLRIPDCKYMENMFKDFFWLNVQTKSPTQTILYQLNEIWFYESDQNAPCTWKESGGKQWQHSIRSWKYCTTGYFLFTLQWHQTKCNGISNHQCLNCLITGLFRHRSKKASKVHVTGLCEGNSPVTGKFSVQRASDTENISICWHHHDVPDLPCTKSEIASYIDLLVSCVT